MLNLKVSFSIGSETLARLYILYLASEGGKTKRSGPGWISKLKFLEFCRDQFYQFGQSSDTLFGESFDETYKVPENMQAALHKLSQWKLI